MSFNIGNSDRLPATGGGTNANYNKNPLQQAINSSQSKHDADMILTPDHPSWHADHSSAAQGSSQQNAQNNNTGGQSGPGAPYTGGHANTGNTGPFRAGPDHESYLPSNAVPQGARFDPIVPEDVRQSLPNRNAAGHHQGQGRPGQNPLGFASGEPDYDELLPPN